MFDYNMARCGTESRNWLIAPVKQSCSYLPSKVCIQENNEKWKWEDQNGERFGARGKIRERLWDREQGLRKGKKEGE